MFDYDSELNQEVSKETPNYPCVITIVSALYQQNHLTDSCRFFCLLICQMQTSFPFIVIKMSVFLEEDYMYLCKIKRPQSRGDE